MLSQYNLLKVGTLQPSLQPLAARLIELAGERGIPLDIVQSTRTHAQQQAIYDQGRTAPGNIVTQARPGDSYHQYGLAFDVVPTAYKTLHNWNPSGPLWGIVGEIGESLGLEWGGRWKSIDRPHFQIPSSLAPLEELKAYWQKFKSVMPITIEPTTGGAAMILLVLLGIWIFSRWAGRVV